MVKTTDEKITRQLKIHKRDLTTKVVRNAVVVADFPKYETI